MSQLQSLCVVPRMRTLTNHLMKKYYAGRPHPYRIFQSRVENIIQTGAQTILDAGCGRSAMLLRELTPQPRMLIGMDLVAFEGIPSQNIFLINGDVSRIPLRDCTIDCIYSRSVFEHLVNPCAVYKDMYRVLKPGGRLVILTANIWDYATLMAILIPGFLHPRIVKFVEGRGEDDTFPTVYRSNTYSAIKRHAEKAGFIIEEFEYLSQYPNYLTFNGFLFFLGTCYEHLIRKIEALRFFRGWIMAVLKKPQRSQ